MEIQKIEYFKNGKSFLNEIKTSFKGFEGLWSGEKHKLYVFCGLNWKNNVYHNGWILVVIEVTNVTRETEV